jgi:hypothetical protein
MNDDLIRANLNLYAVLQNLEELVAMDSEAAELVRDWDLTMQFTVRKGPAASLIFSGGKCVHRPGRSSGAAISLYFLSPSHCNRMFEGRAMPVILRGFTRLSLLTGGFTRLTKRLEHYLKPHADLLADPSYLAINTTMTLNTAAFAVRELALLDPECTVGAAQVGRGSVLIKVQPRGPAATIDFGGDAPSVSKDERARPTCALLIKNFRIANDFFAGRSDVYTAVALGDIAIRGMAPMLDSLGVILARIPRYLS